jgi:orotidine-5'-phosphate decarboxylase
VIDEISQFNTGMAGARGHRRGDRRDGRTDRPRSDQLNGPILAPGLGAQGGRAGDLRAVFGDAVGDVLPSWSREVLGAGPDVVALRGAAQRARDACASAIAVTAWSPSRYRPSISCSDVAEMAPDR